MGSTIISGIRSGFFSGSTGLEASLFLKLTGGTMVGPLILYGDPILPLEAATKQYVDAHSKDHVSIALTMPSQFVVTGSPAAWNGTFTVALADQSPHMVFAGPASSTLPAAPPSFRALVSADISDLDVGVESIFGRTGVVTAASGDYTADLVTLSPAISSWTNVQGALAGIESMLANLSRGMSYVGSFDAAANIATFVPGMAALNGPLPPANAAQLHAGDFLICTSASATFGTGVQVGDQIISNGPGGGPTWNILKVGQAVITAGMVPLSPVIRTWNTVQAAVQAISDGATQTPWAQNIDANNYMLYSPTGVALRFGTNGTTERMRITAEGRIGVGRGDPTAFIDMYRNVAAGVAPLGFMLRIAQKTNDGVDTDSNQIIRFEHNNGSNSRHWDMGVGSNRFGNVDNFGFWDNYVTDFPMMVIRRATGSTSFGNNQDRQPSSTASHTSLYVGRSDGANHFPGRCVLIGNTTATATYSGEVIWANYQIAVTEKRIGAISVNTGTTLDSGRMYLQTMDAGTVSAKITILQDGRVGIGTTGPTCRLHVHDASTELDRITCIFARHLTDQNFQIVVTNSETLGVTDTGGMKFGMWYNHPTANNMWNCGLRFWRGSTYGNGYMTVETSHLERMRFAANGNIGIGTTNPLRLLHISGGDIIWDQEGSVTSPGPTLFTGTASVNQDRYLALINSPAATNASGLKAGGILCADMYNFANPGKNQLVVKGNTSIGNDGSVFPDSNLNSTFLIVGSRTTGTNPGEITAISNVTVANSNVGLFQVANYAIAGTEKRIASMVANRGTTNDSGYWVFGTMNAGVLAERMRITQTGVMRVGAIPAAGVMNLQISNEGLTWTQNANELQRFRMYAGDAYIDFQRYNDAGTPTTFFSLRRSDGFVGIGQPTPSYMLHVGIDSAGKPGTNTWTIASDIRTKRNIQPFQGGMEVIRQLEPQVAEYNGMGGTPDGMRVVSLDPEELREIVPFCVSSVKAKLRETDKEDSDILGVNTHEIFYHLLRAVQQLDKRLEKLES